MALDRHARTSVRALAVAWLALATGLPASVSASDAELPTRSAIGLMMSAKADGRVGQAQKTKPIDARPAIAGEIIVTVIADEGVETRSPPSQAGDFVVRNRCPETGDEQYLVAAAKFASRYDGPFGDADHQGWREFRPRGPVLDYFIVPHEVGSFRFEAPWGEAMIAHPDDAIVQDPSDRSDTYRIAAKSFACTYEVLRPPPEG